MSRHERPRPPRRVVIGVGNPYRRDDAAGLEVARRVRAAAPRWVEVVEHDGEPAGLLDLWEQAQVAVVVDALRSFGAVPGVVRRLEVACDPWRPGSPSVVSSHASDPGDAVELARVLDRLPERLVIYGIEGKSFSPGVGLSAELEASIPALADRVVKEVSR